MSRLYRGYPRWTDEEIEKLKKLYPKLSKAELLKHFPNRTWSAIRDRAYRIGVKRPPEWAILPPPLNLSVEVSAYLAGLIDGEGSITVSAHKHKDGKIYLNPQIQITNSNIKLIKWISRNVTGGKFISKRSMKKRWGRRPMFTFSTRSMGYTYRLLQEVLPFLVAKKKQALLLLKFLESRLKRAQKLWLPNQYLGYTREEIKLANKIRQLNDRIKSRVIEEVQINRD